MDKDWDQGKSKNNNESRRQTFTFFSSVESSGIAEYFQFKQTKSDQYVKFCSPKGWSAALLQTFP